MSDTPAKNTAGASVKRMVSPLELDFLAALKRYKSAEESAARFHSKAATMGLALMYSRLLKAMDELAVDIEKRANAGTQPPPG